MFGEFFNILKTLLSKLENKKVFNYIEPVIYILLFVLSVSYIIDASFNPFSYFRF